MKLHFMLYMAIIAILVTCCIPPAWAGGTLVGTLTPTCSSPTGNRMVCMTVELEDPCQDFADGKYIDAYFLDTNQDPVFQPMQIVSLDLDGYQWGLEFPMPEVSGTLYAIVMDMWPDVGYVEIEFGTALDPDNVIYVDSSLQTNGNGESWSTAKNDLASALSSATFGNEVWAAGGFSCPTYGFSVPAGVGLFGGFAGNETELVDRDWNANPTTLSGTNWDPNGYGIVVAQTGSIVDGFKFVECTRGITGFDTLLIGHNVFDDVSTCIQIYGGSSPSGCQHTVANNLMTGYYSGICLIDAGDSVVRYNTLVGEDLEASTGISSNGYPESAPVVSQNIVVHNWAALSDWATIAMTGSGVVVYDNTYDEDGSPEVGLISGTSPGFVGSGTHPYALSGTSCAIDIDTSWYGDFVYYGFDKDIRCNPRGADIPNMGFDFIDGTLVYDAGAYEYQP